MTDSLKPAFGEAAEALHKTSFSYYIRKRFGYEAALSVQNIFADLGLPVPQEEQEFVKAFDGALVFSNKYGVVIRIEALEASNGAERLITPWILQPLASFRNKNTIQNENRNENRNIVVEILPGCHSQKDESMVEFLVEQLRKLGVYFGDAFRHNIGRLPYATASFPDGVPVITDQLVATQNPINFEKLKYKFLKAIGRAAEPKIPPELAEAAEAQKVLYEPLQEAFDAAWTEDGLPDAEKMKAFWTLCERHVQDGKLVAGWNEIDPNHYREGEEKGIAAAHSAKAYDARLQEAENKGKRHDDGYGL